MLKSLAIGDVRLGRIAAPVRESSPSLVGASLLEHFVVTLDTMHSTAYFDEYRGGPFMRPSYGFGLDFNEEVSVSLVWEDSPASAAGLQAGQHVTSINGQAADTSCDGIRTAMQAMFDGDTIDFEWEGGATTLVRENPVPD